MPRSAAGYGSFQISPHPAEKAATDQQQRTHGGKYNARMGFLSGKKILVTGLLSNRSIAYGIAKAARREGAELAFTYVGRPLQGSRHGPGARIRLRPRASLRRGERRADRGAVRSNCGKRWDGLDGLVHAIGFAPREAIAGEFLDGLSREAFREAHDISAYSFPALAKAALPMMEGRTGALLTLTYLGAERADPALQHHGAGQGEPGGLACATWRRTSGPKGIRVNAISAGPIKTLAAAGHRGLRQDPQARRRPSRRCGAMSRIEDVGNAAAFLLSDLAAGITAEILYVDGGFNVVSVTIADEPERS